MVGSGSPSYRKIEVRVVLDQERVCRASEGEQVLRRCSDMVAPVGF